MNKVFLVAKREFMTNIKQPSFLFAAFGIPIFITLIMVVIMSIAINSATKDLEIGKIAYVDQASIISSEIEQAENFVSVETPEQAREMLDAGELGAYIVIPANYFVTGNIEVYSYENLNDVFKDDLNRFLRQNLSAGLETNFPVERLQEEMNLTVSIENTGRVLPEDAAFGLFLTPMIFAIVFLMASQITATFLMSSIVEEKSNRIMEILITSMTPMQLLMGKLIGLGLLGLTQLFIWIALGVVIASIGSDIPILTGILIPPDLIILSVIYFIFTYFLLGSMMAGISVVVGAEQEARQVAGFLVFPFVLPFFFIVQLIDDPNGGLSIFLTMFPFSAAMTVIMRASFVVVPIEQIILSLTILIGSTILITWISAKVFRWATLLYGKRATPREIWRVIRAKEVDVGSQVVGEAV